MASEKLFLLSPGHILLQLKYCTSLPQLSLNSLPLCICIFEISLRLEIIHFSSSTLLYLVHAFQVIQIAAFQLLNLNGASLCTHTLQITFSLYPIINKEEDYSVSWKLWMICTMEIISYIFGTLCSSSLDVYLEWWFLNHLQT